MVIKVFIIKKKCNTMFIKRKSANLYRKSAKLSLNVVRKIADSRKRPVEQVNEEEKQPQPTTKKAKKVVNNTEEPIEQ